MNKRNMLLWVQALRSGDYRQGKGRLKKATPRGFEYCCLGVACEVARADGLKLQVLDDPDDGVVVIEGCTMFLPRKVTAWLGLNTDAPQVGWDEGEPVNAITANDFLGWTFGRIADGIESFYRLGEVDNDPSEPAPVS